MIAPRSKLLFWVAAVVLPFGLVAAVEPGSARVSLGFITALLLAAIADALSAPSRLNGILLEFPEIVRMSKDREAKLEVRVKNGKMRARIMRLAIDWPDEIIPAEEETDVQLPTGAGWSTLSLGCTPAARGSYPLRRVYIESGSFLGFWSARKKVEVRSELRVYPNLLRDRNDLAALFLNRGTLGLHAQRQVGKGRDFEKLRDYAPGDSFDEIHWKASARRGRPITKVFQVERAQEVYVVIDASRLSARESRRRVLRPGAQNRLLDEVESDLERYVTAALVLGLAAEKQGDLFGLVAFSDKIDRFVRAKAGHSHQASCRDTLYNLQSRSVAPDFEEVCSFIRHRLRRRALLIFLTALDDPALAESFCRDIELIRRQHVVLVNMPQPSGAAPLFANPDVETTDDVYQRLGGHLLWQNLRELEMVLGRRGVHFAQLKNERLSAELVSQYIGIKRRQLL